MTIQKSRFSSEAAPQPAGSQPPQPSLAKWLPLTSQYIEGKAVQTVNARELHSFLKVGRDFSNWIKDRIAEYGFVEGVDYVVFTKFGENPPGGADPRRNTPSASTWAKSWRWWSATTRAAAPAGTSSTVRHC
nr:antA/AntB antirepressor family protein [Aeromonas veronii]